MTPATNHKRLEATGQATIQAALQERMRLAIKCTLIQILEEEVDAFVNASPYQRTFERRDYRNGTYKRDLGTSMGVIEDVPVPADAWRLSDRSVCAVSPTTGRTGSGDLGDVRRRG